MREVTYDDLRRELTVSEWWAWTSDLLADLRGTDAGREYMRFHKGPMKRFKEEVIPTLRFVARQFPGHDILVPFPSSNRPGSPDALVRGSGSSASVPVQVTCDWTHEDELRLQIVHRDGFVDGWGAIDKVNGRLEAAAGMYSLEGVTAKVSELIAKRLAAKAAHGGYAADTWLLVHINDERWPPEAFPDVLNQAKAAAAASPFAATVLVGSSDEKRICALLAGSIRIPC